MRIIIRLHELGSITGHSLTLSRKGHKLEILHPIFHAKIYAPYTTLLCDFALIYVHGIFVVIRKGVISHG